MKQYKYKKEKIKNSTDLKRVNKVRKNLNSSERLKTKTEIKKDLVELNYSKRDIRNIRYDLEYEAAMNCHLLEKHGPEAKLSLTLYKLGIVNSHDANGRPNWNPYRCTCPDFASMSHKDLLNSAGCL